MDRAAQLRDFINGEVEDDLTDEERELQQLPTLTGEEVQAGGKTRRVALYSFEVGHNEGGEIPVFTRVQAGDVALLSDAQAARLDSVGFTSTDADFKNLSGEKKPTRKS